jgi:hypothetical protein
MTTYTVLSGKAHRLLRTSTPAGGAPVSTVVTTLPDPGTADAVAAALTDLTGNLPTVLFEVAAADPGRPTAVTRAALTAYDTARGDGPLTARVARIGAAVATCPDAVRRAVRDEVAAVLDGYDGILVPATAHSDDHVVEVRFVANPYLATASDDQIRWIVEEGFGDGDATDQVVYALGDGPATAPLCAYLRTLPTSYGAPVGFTCRIDPAAMRAWIAANRPHLADA